MKAAVFYNKEDVHLEDLPRPRIGPGELLLDVEGIGLCGSDIDKITAEAVSPGTVLGHEVVGTVAEIGKRVEKLKVGDRIVVAHHVSCQECHYCVRGSDSKCELFRSTNFDPGGFAEFVRVPEPNVRLGAHLIPDHVSNEEAVFTEPLACCLRAVERSPVRAGDVILIVGSGAIGLLFIQLVKLAQATVIATDILRDRLKMALQYGADIALHPAEDPIEEIVRKVSEGRGVDIVFSTVASQAVLNQALLLVRDGGTINFFAGFRGGLDVTVDLNELYEREVGIITSYSSSPQTLAEAFRLIVDGDIRTAELISHRLPLSKVLQGVQMMVRQEARKVYFKV